MDILRKKYIFFRKREIQFKNLISFRFQEAYPIQSMESINQIKKALMIKQFVTKLTNYVTCLLILPALGSILIKRRSRKIAINPKLKPYSIIQMVAFSVPMIYCFKRIGDIVGQQLYWPLVEKSLIQSKIKIKQREETIYNKLRKSMTSQLTQQNLQEMENLKKNVNKEIQVQKKNHEIKKKILVKKTSFRQKLEVVKSQLF